MLAASSPDLPGALLDSWHRSNAILVNMLGALDDEDMALRAHDDSPTVGALFAHMHYVRLVFVSEDVPEVAVPVPADEWTAGLARPELADRLRASARVVADAVASRLQSGRAMDRHYDHPLLLIQHMIWHEGNHLGQIKLALKRAGRPMPDSVAGPLTWRVWMNKR